MAVRRDGDGRWRYRVVVLMPAGEKKRISGTPFNTNTKAAAEIAEREAIARTLAGASKPAKKEVPTFEKWFDERFWKEWVVAEGNGPGEQQQKRSIYKNHLGPAFGRLRLDQIDQAKVQQFRAQLAVLKRPSGKTYERKTANNILAVLGKALAYAVEAEVIERAPKIGVFKTEAPEISWLEIEDYPRILAAAREQGVVWHLAACLAAEAGLRIGEIRALEWTDIDLVGGTITVSRQSRKTYTGPTKGRRRRTVPINAALRAALDEVRGVRGVVVRDFDGSAFTERRTMVASQQIRERAGVDIRGWHSLRHSFGTHAALFGVNPWRLQAWLGHSSMDQTQRYVHVAETHARELPPEVLAAAAGEADSDRRVLAMLAARGKTVANRRRVGAEAL